MKKEKHKFNYGEICSFIAMTLFGGIFGILMVHFVDKREKDILRNSNIFVFIGLLLLLMVISGIIHIIIHEGGHMIFGLLCGYKFVSFRIGSFTIIKEDNKLKMKKFNLPGTAGQCLLKPCDYNDGDFSYKLYNLGGVIINLLFSLIGFVLMFTIHMNIYVYCSIMAFSLVGVFMAITNGIPMKSKGIANDGYNVLDIGKDENTKKGFWITLMVNALESEGMRIKDMPSKWFEFNEDKLDSSMKVSLEILLANLYYDKLEFQKEREVLEDILDNATDLLGIYENEIKCELSFIELISECRKDKIDELWDKDLDKYIISCKHNITKKRLQYAKALVLEKDNNKARDIYGEIMKLSKTYPIKAEVEREIEVVNYVKDKYTK